MAVMVIMSVSTLFVSAEGNTADVYVTISDKGTLAVSAEKITVTDTDGDGALTVTDALYCAHEKFYTGGAAAGYATENTQWGLSLSKLWGTSNGGSYGYYINNASAWSLTDPVKADDYVAAYSFSDPDPKSLSDKYTYFDKLVEDITAGEITLTLNKADFDADWNPITVPVEGAVITVDGVASSSKTDAQGKATVKLDVNGKHIVSATADGQVIVPPVYVVNVTGGVDPVPATTPESGTVAPTQPSTQPATQAATQQPTQKATNDSSKSSGSNTNAVKTGPSSAVYVIISLALAALAVTFMMKKRNEE